ncbi:MAG TPA: sugar ABC transporter permease [Lachnospiraceae bacterium]|nr:sugar ABC transporter permease [Lachnospiraceae bacterium]
MAEKKQQVKVPKKKASRREKKDWVAGYLFIAPVTLGLLVFYIFPFIQNFWFSFNNVNKFNMATFCGLENYSKMIVDTELYQTLWNTLKYVVITVPVGLFLSILLAALLNSEIKGKSFYRTIYFLPSVTMSVAVSLIWKWIYNGEYGILNAILKVFGLEGQNWLSNQSTAFYCVMIVGIWCSVGYNMIILLAGMQGISKSLYEAAAIDGAGPKDQFFHVTMPMLTPTIFFVMITSIIGGFQVFDTIYMMIGKTSMAYESCQTMIAMFYRYGFEFGKKGYAAAISIFVFLIIMVVTAFQMWGQKKWVNYD